MRTRNIRVSVRLDEAEHERLEQLKQATGLNGESLIRTLLKGCEVKAKPTAELIEVRRQLAEISNSMRQIEFHARRGQLTQAEAQQAMNYVSEAWRVMHEL